jgi:hypothetical protein
VFEEAQERQRGICAKTLQEVEVKSSKDLRRTSSGRAALLHSHRRGSKSRSSQRRKTVKVEAFGTLEILPRQEESTRRLW